MSNEIPVEVKTLLSDWKSLPQTYDLATWAYDNAMRKDATWFDHLVFFGTAAYFGYSVGKTISDGQKAYQALTSPKITALTPRRPVRVEEPQAIYCKDWVTLSKNNRRNVLIERKESKPFSIFN